MIYELTRDLADMLAARKFPQPVIYGPEWAQRLGGAHAAIVVERDRQGGDRVGPPIGQLRAPRKAASRYLGVVATIYASAQIDGAHIGDHEREAEQLVDALIVSLDEWAAATKAGEIEYTSSRYLAPEEIALQGWPGVVYELRFLVGRGVRKLDYLGSGPPTGAPAGVSNQTSVSYVQSDDSQIGCGA